ncbi:hypothetical protein ACFL6S_14810 [Candidatus Poribacteria bacterium]
MILLAKSYDGYFARQHQYFVILSEAKNLPCSGCLGEILRFAQNDNDEFANSIRTVPTVTVSTP